jgi:hypothetical protein
VTGVRGFRGFRGFRGVPWSGGQRSGCGAKLRGGRGAAAERSEAGAAERLRSEAPRGQRSGCGAKLRGGSGAAAERSEAGAAERLRSEAPRGQRSGCGAKPGFPLTSVVPRVRLGIRAPAAKQPQGKRGAMPPRPRIPVFRTVCLTSLCGHKKARRLERARNKGLSYPPRAAWSFGVFGMGGLSRVRGG